MNINNTEISCGVWQLDHFIRFEPIEEELKFLVRYVKTRSVSKPAFFIWSHYECVEGVEYSRTGGHQFAELVNGRFGTVTKSERAKNPNTGNMIVLWYWTVDWDKIDKWWKDLKLQGNQEVNKGL